MKYIIYLVFTVFLYSTAWAQKSTPNQYAQIDKLILSAPDSLATVNGIASFISSNFDDTDDRIRAAFIWIASNIQYDVDNMFAINLYETRKDKVEKTLRTRKGTCESYAAIFSELCSQLGVKSYIIEGYTKQQGFVDYIPHAWCAALVDEKWYIYDPTWGAGYVSNGKFYKKTNNTYFKATPTTIIKSHMPFDCLWQFLEYPISSQEFYESKTQQNSSKPYFNYSDSIKTYETQTQLEQLESSVQRIERNGIRNSLTYDRLQYLKREIENIKIVAENERITNITNLYNSAVVDYNDAIQRINLYTNYWNSKFTPEKTDEEIQEMINIPSNKLKVAKDKLTQIENPDVNTALLVKQLSASVLDGDKFLAEQQEWLANYFSKNKSARKRMFYSKTSWFGIPIN